MIVIDHVIEGFLTRSDVADLALFIWAVSASLGAFIIFKELIASQRRFDEFLRELNRFNTRWSDEE